MTTFTQPDTRFRGVAFQYIRAGDALPTHEEIADEPDPVCKVKLFLPGSRWTYYVAALTAYGTMLVVTGWCVSPHGPDCDEWGDSSLQEIAAVRSAFGLPPERDDDFAPLPLSDLRRRLEADGHAP